MRCMEDPELRKLKEKAELSYALNDQKVALFKLKEELYYAVDEKTMSPILPSWVEPSSILMILMPSCCQTSARHSPR
jgi:hypothetical protein